MNQTPLSLEHYFFTRVRIEANPEYVANEEAGIGQHDLDAGIKLEVFQHEADPYRYQISLTVDKVAVREGVLPYDLDLQVVGFFSVDPELKHRDIDKLVRVNGASMLYTAAREYLLVLTGRGPWGTFQLPTVNFHGAISANEADGEKTSDSTKL